MVAAEGADEPYVLELYHKGRLIGLMMSTDEFNVWNGGAYIDDIIREHGARVPSAADSQKAFRAFVVMLTPRPLAEREWAQVDGQMVDFSMMEK